MKSNKKGGKKIEEIKESESDEASEDEVVMIDTSSKKQGKQAKGGKAQHNKKKGN